MDTGNFMEDPYDKLEKIAPFTTFVQAKTYFGGGEGIPSTHRHAILSEVGYNGCVSIEFTEAPTGVARALIFS